MIPEDAIWILELIRNRDARTEAEKDAVNAAIDAIKAQLSQEGTTKDTTSDLPSIQPEPKEGHWIDKGWNGDWAWQTDGRGNCWRVIECSECGKSSSVESNYCPHCGADMRGEQDGNA